jgi:hypothetical protein
MHCMPLRAGGDKGAAQHRSTGLSLQALLAKAKI